MYSQKPRKPTKFLYLFQQIDKLLTQMLQNLTYIYKNHHIDYQVLHFHTVIMRIISPIELFNAERQRGNWGIYPFEGGYGYEQEYREGGFEADRNFNGGYRSERENKEGEFKTSFNFEQKQEFNLQKPRNFICKQPFLGLDNEAKLCDWIRQQYKKSGRVNRKNFLDEARRRAEYDGLDFRASSGWFSRFLGRNPDIRQYMNSQRMEKYKVAAQQVKQEDLYFEQQEQQQELQQQQMSYDQEEQKSNQKYLNQNSKQRQKTPPTFF